MQQRSDNVILPYLAAAGIIVFTPIFFILAVWVYKIIRPHEKIGEVWERNLAEEALLAEVESIQHCPTCDRTHQRRVDHLSDLPDAAQPGLPELQPPRRLDWSLCAWCGKDFERREVAAAAVLEPTTSRRDATARVPASTATERPPRSARRPGPR